MPKFLNRFLLISLLVCSTTSLAEQILKVGVGNFPPFFIEDEKKGIFIEIIDEIFKQLPQYKVEYIFMSNHRTNYIKTVIDESNNLPYQLYFVKVDSAKILGKKNIFSDKLCTELNNGPISFNLKRDFAVVSLNQATQTQKKKNNAMGLYFISKANGNWSDPIPFKYNSNNNPFLNLMTLTNLDGWTVDPIKIDRQLIRSFWSRNIA